MDFPLKIEAAWKHAGASLCVGLDPIISRMPRRFAEAPRPVLAFNRHVIDLVADRVCAFKPQFAHHAALAAEADLAETIDYIRERAPHALVILDAKRGDIGSTAEMYAKEAFDRYGADAVTVNPFMGDDSVLPFLDRADRAAVVLCRTTNPDSARYQRLPVEGRPLFVTIAERAESVWNARRNVMLVVGAALPEDIAVVRAAAPSLAFLVPGVGEQGGSAQEVIRRGAWPDGRGLIVSASRSILYAGDDQAILAAVEATRDQLHAGLSRPVGETPRRAAAPSV
jgi:orotidine-5'-phosphate decarboxylase